MSLSAQAIDRMKEAIGGDVEALADILQSFIDEAGPLVESLGAASRQKQTEAMRRIAHTIKASARDFGDSGLANLCAALELEARTGVVEDAAERAAQIASACLLLRRDIVQYMSTELGVAGS